MFQAPHLSTAVESRTGMPFIFSVIKPGVSDVRKIGRREEGVYDDAP